MDSKTHIILAAELLKICGCNDSSAIYSLLPIVNRKDEHHKRIYANSLSNYHLLLNSALEIFTGKQENVSKKSYIYTSIEEKKEYLFKLLAQTRQLVNTSYKIDFSDNISNNKISAALSLISYNYINSLFYPTQFFLPHSSSCSGQWAFWEQKDYFEFLEKINKKEFQFDFREKMIKNNIWNTEFKPEEFPEIIKRRLIKENVSGKELNPEAMIKAMIIRMGELAKPTINYEVIDYSIRSFFTYLGTNKYIRVDREIRFLRMFEKEVIDILSLDF